MSLGKMKVDKPLKMYPVIIIGLLLGAFINLAFTPIGIFLGCSIIYRHNVKRFGKRYWVKFNGITKKS